MGWGKAPLKGRIYYRLFGHDHMGLRVRAFHVKRMLRAIGEPVSILDAGCGEGCYSFYLSKKYPYAEVTGIDIDPQAIFNCNLVLHRIGRKNLKFVEATLVKLDISATFDLICCVDVLEHIMEDEQVLRNLFRALSPEGSLILHVPRRYLSLPAHSGRRKGHVRDEYTEEEIVEKVERAGFAITEKRYTFGPFGSLARKAHYKLEELPGGIRIFLKAAFFPILISLAYADTSVSNRRHEGFLFLLMKSIG